MSSLLITQCLQKDFVAPIGPFDALPNMLHIGAVESRRLMGEDPQDGPVTRFMEWAHLRSQEEIRIIHIRDWHKEDDPAQREHISRFGNHCMQGSSGADFVFALPNHTNGCYDIINSLSLNDFLGTSLSQLLSLHMSATTRIGIVGVWTDVKVHFLAYELRTRFPDAEIAICSALTASSSRSRHLLALEQMQNILGIKVLHTCGCFQDFLAGSTDQTAWSSVDTYLDNVVIETDRELNAIDSRIVKMLFRNSSHVLLTCLDGGFSGNVVVSSESRDMFGHQEVSHVVKIGPRELIGRERIAFETIEGVLGNNAPRIADFTDFQERGGIKYRYASMLGGRSKTFQKLYVAGLPLGEIDTILHTVFVDQLGKLYAAAVPQQCDLLDYYEFSPKWASSVEKTIVNLGISESMIQHYLPGISYYDLSSFYREDLELVKERFPESVLFSYVHGDLNGANVMIDGNSNVWLIDFFHTHRGHILKDLIKFENDIMYIFTSVKTVESLRDAARLSDSICAVQDLATPLPDVEDTAIQDEQIKRCYSVIKILRSFYAPILKTYRNPIQFYIGHLRYAVHTLSFDESSLMQKIWAWYTAGLCARNITSYYLKNVTLRIDWLPLEYTAPGKVGLTILPGRKDRNRDLLNDIEVLINNQITDAVVLVTSDELQQYGVSDIFSKYKDAGITVYHLPVLDQMVCSIEEMNTLLMWMNDRLSKKAGIIIHCLGGLGRSGTVAGCLLKNRGLSAQDAINVVRKVRTGRAIESSVQEAMVLSF